MIWGTDEIEAIQEMLKTAVPEKINVVDALILMDLMIHYRVTFPNGRSACGESEGDIFCTWGDWATVFAKYVPNIFRDDNVFDPIDLKGKFMGRSTIYPPNVEQLRNAWILRLEQHGFVVTHP